MEQHFKTKTAEQICRFLGVICRNKIVQLDGRPTEQNQFDKNLWNDTKGYPTDIFARTNVGNKVQYRLKRTCIILATSPTT